MELSPVARILPVSSIRGKRQSSRWLIQIAKQNRTHVDWTYPHRNNNRGWNNTHKSIVFFCKTTTDVTDDQFGGPRVRPDLRLGIREAIAKRWHGMEIGWLVLALEQSFLGSRSSKQSNRIYGQTIIESVIWNVRLGSCRRRRLTIYAFDGCTWQRNWWAWLWRNWCARFAFREMRGKKKLARQYKSNDKRNINGTANTT